jgi:hypothetical protein
VLAKENGIWTANGSALDSAGIYGYLASIASVSCENFVDDQKPVSGKPDFSVMIERENSVNPIIISAFAADSIHGYLINSSENKGAYFSGKQSGLLNRIFISRKKFVTTVK